MIGALTGFAALDHAVADLVGMRLARVLPGSQHWWRTTGHAAFLGALAVGGIALFDHVAHGLETGATAFEPLLDESVETTWIGLDGERRVQAATFRGRRSAGKGGGTPSPTSGRRRCAPGRTGVPDLSHRHRDGARPHGRPPSRSTSVWTAHRRARPGRAGAWPSWTGPAAWDRSMLMLISPTGTGYVNYCAVAATAVPHPGRRRHRHPAVLQTPVAAVAGPDRAPPASRTGCSCCTCSTACAADPPTAGPGWCCSARVSARTPARTS